MATDLLWPAGLTFLLGAGAIGDIWQRRLPNWLALLLLVYGLTYAALIDGLPAMGWHAAHAAIALLVGMVLFAIRAVGGGDAKFYAGAASYFALADGFKLFAWVSLAGFITLLIWLVAKRLPPFSKRPREGDFAKFPYGVAVAVGASGFAWTGAL